MRIKISDLAVFSHMVRKAELSSSLIASSTFHQKMIHSGENFQLSKLCEKWRLGAVVLTTLIISLPAFALDLPQRKSGLWSISTTMPGLPEQSAKQCVDSVSDAQMMEKGLQMGAGMGITCSKMESHREGKKFIMESDCSGNGTHITSKVVMDGDFDSAYTSTADMNYNPPLMGQSKLSVVSNAKWLGPCEAGQSPGDIILSNGMKMNMMNMNPPGAATGK